MQDIERQLNRYLAFVANRAVYAIRRAWAAAAEDAGLDLTPEEFLVMEMLSVRDGLNQSELTLVAVRDRTTVTRLVDGLVRKGLVRREHGSEDRRVVRTYTTAKGRRVHQQAMQMVLRLRKQAYEGLSLADVEHAMNVLHQLRCNLIGDGEEGEAAGLEEDGVRRRDVPPPGSKPVPRRPA